jgi:hypothetical protein
LLALAAVAIPGISSAGVIVTVAPPWAEGPQGGDQYNHFTRNTASGELQVLRVNPAGISGGLGCGGTGGFSYFKHAVTSGDPVTSVEVFYKDAIVDPYTWMKAVIVKDGAYVGRADTRGPVLGNGSIDVRLSSAVAPPFEVRFGIEVASACPNIDGGRAIFDRLWIQT